MQAVQSMARNMASNMMQSNGMQHNVMQNQQQQYPMNNFQQQQNYRPNNQHHQGRNDYNMFNQNQQYPSNFQGQNYRQNMQSMRFKRQVNGNTKPHGSDANNLPGFLELGDRLAEKLKETQEHAIAKIGNFTCVMKELNVLNEQNQIDVRGMKKQLEKYNMPSEWFKNHDIKNIE